MTQSETLGKLSSALAKAQASLMGAKKDATNPFFKSTYADLSSVWEACRKALTANGLCVAQPTEIIDGVMVLKTMLIHESGEYISGYLPIMAGDKATAQQVGSAITYARRYALAAMVGVAPEDDDGNEAQNAPHPQRKTAPANTVKPDTKAPSLEDRAKAFEQRMDSLKSGLAVTNLVSVNNPLLLELKEKHPAMFEALSVKINQTIEAFQLSEVEK